MLIGFMTFIALAAAGGLALLLDGFAGFGWLWQLPVGFFGAFLIQLIVVFLTLVIMASLVKMDETQEKDNKLYRFVIHEVAALLITLLGVKIDVKGREKLPKDKRIMVVCNHLNDVDPIVLLQNFKKYELAFISKRENDRKFLIGPFLRAILCQPINRENDREALKTILRCISLLKEDEVSIAIFPEGRINPYRKLAHFRPGVFKIAQKANVPIVVCTMRSTNTVIPRLLKGKGSTVDLHLLEVIPAEALQGRTTTDIAQQVYEIMAADLGPENVLTPEEEENT